MLTLKGLNNLALVSQGETEMKTRQQSGFTLVEISIVLVIIGLLLGGVLKGQEIISNAKIKNAVNDFNGISAAVYAYQDRYNALPGDDKKAGTRWAGATSGDGDGSIQRYWWYSNRTESGYEQGHFWHHLRLSGLISGSTTGIDATESPTHAFGSFTGVGYYPLYGWASGPTKICMKGILGKDAEVIDTQMDDGNPITGGVRSGVHVYTPGTDAAYVQETVYNVCKLL